MLVAALSTFLLDLAAEAAFAFAFAEPFLGSRLGSASCTYVLHQLVLNVQSSKQGIQSDGCTACE